MPNKAALAEITDDEVLQRLDENGNTIGPVEGREPHTKNEHRNQSRIDDERDDRKKTLTALGYRPPVQKIAM